MLTCVILNTPADERFIDLEHQLPSQSSEEAC